MKRLHALLLAVAAAPMALAAYGIYQLLTYPAATVQALVAAGWAG